MNSSIDYAYAYDMHKQTERFLAEEKARQMSAIRQTLAKHFDWAASDESLEAAAQDLYLALNPEPEIDELF
jgi:hypothetical protein